MPLTPTELHKLAGKFPLSASTLARNKPEVVSAITNAVSVVATPSKRLRQSTKPIMNKLESEWFAVINAHFPNCPRPRAQAIRFRLGNGVTYSPDFTSTHWPDPAGPSRFTAWEVKGKHSWDDAIVKIKLAATIWPEVRWLLVWKDGNDDWQQQEILP